METQTTFFEQKLKYEIDAWDLKELLTNGEKVKIIDARSINAFNNEHIAGAINIPHRTMTPENTSSFDIETLYVIYCDGIGCNASTKGALNMSRLGFKVKELIGGIDWWKRDGYETHGQKVGETNSINCDC
jgi:rhodanese-related sulfurtransferase